jgi:hypothetical protein
MAAASGDRDFVVVLPRLLPARRRPPHVYNSICRRVLTDAFSLKLCPLKRPARRCPMSTSEQLPQRRHRDDIGDELCAEVSRLAARVASLAQSCHAQSLKPFAVAARAAAGTATRDAQVAMNAAATARADLVELRQRCAALEDAVSGPDNSPSLRHALEYAPAALRIFRFAANSAPRVLELAHVCAFLRECAVEFGSADAALPGALRCEFAAKRFFRLRDVVERYAALCPWLAAKVLACRSGAPMPAAALAPDVTRHDVNWGAEGARRHEWLAVSDDGSSLALTDNLLEGAPTRTELLLEGLLARSLPGYAWARLA